MILGLILMALVGLQSCAVSFGGALGDSSRMEQGGAIGVLVALLFLERLVLADTSYPGAELRPVASSRACNDSPRSMPVPPRMSTAAEWI